jgi:hypothetical protein
MHTVDRDILNTKSCATKLELGSESKNSNNFTSMNTTLFITTNKWYQTLLVWELYRIVYNLLMIGAGLVGFIFIYVNIPLIYIFIGLIFNGVYTILWAIDLIIKRLYKIDYSKKIFIFYYLTSALFVIAIPAALRFIL